MNTSTDNLYDRLTIQLHKSTRLLHRSRHHSDGGLVENEGARIEEKRTFPQVPRSQIRLLRALAQTDSMTMKEIVEEFDIRPSSASELVSKLEVGGYATRQVDNEDKRVANISITEEGRAFADEVDSGRKERFAALFSSLTQEELEELVGLLEKLNDSMREKVGSKDGSRCRPHHRQSHHGHRHCHRHMDR